MADEQPQVKQVVASRRWAEDVVAAYSYFGRKANSRKLSKSALALHAYSANPENHKDFFSMVQRASDLLSKLEKDAPTDDQVAKAEHKSIAELKVFLAKAVEKLHAKTEAGFSHSA